MNIKGLLILVLIKFTALNAIAMQQNYNQGLEYRNVVSSGNPNDISDTGLLNHNTNHLSNMNDQDLRVHGNNALNNSEEGRLILNVNSSKEQNNYNFNIAHSNEFSLEGNNIFCGDGNCHTPVIGQNLDMTNVAYLAMLNEMKNDMRLEPIRVFEGHAKGCRKSATGYLNCCTSMKGWGRSVGLSRCNAEERALALKRGKGQCHLIGTYCSKRAKITKRCLTKRTVFCCFNSKLAKIFQEQGKMQLGMNFGVPQSTNCLGFTVPEVQRIDFSKFNMEELFSDVLMQAQRHESKNLPNNINTRRASLQNKSY
ncbi:MAG TPA: conjugal transfer protein TraN [Rickettsia endosymbiont of Omalisus fontisbellaquei]|nr:conjugal transfer protein TraN [Rickettsia endosymbiont of Omalisus fontisbellaquei]